MDKKFIEQMAELDDAAQGIYVVPCPVEDREEMDAMTKRAIELMKQGKFKPEYATPPQQKS